jgi:hypothetical protein
MYHFGIELEFFVDDSKGNLVPAYKAGITTDGNPIIGEIRTNVHTDIVSAIFELKKLIFVTQKKLLKKDYHMVIIPSIEVPDTFLKNIRKSEEYREFLGKKEYSDILCIYGEENTSLLPNNKFVASLQLNISSNKTLSIANPAADYPYISKVISELFDYRKIILELDELFKADIERTNRNEGIYSIKEGEKGKRIEYRSLPNDIDFMKLLEIPSINE